LVKIGS